MSVLVDSNVWIKHFRRANPFLSDLLEEGEVLCHPLVIGELAMGNLPRRKDTLLDFAALLTPQLASWEESRHLVEEQNLFGSGIQWNDAQLLASCILSRVQLWTTDKRLKTAADALGVSFPAS